MNSSGKTDSLVAQEAGIVIRRTGDSALLVEFEQKIDLSIAARVQGLLAWLEEKQIPGIIEAIPGYSTVLIHYDAVRVHADTLQGGILKAAAMLPKETVPPKTRIVEIPVCYGGKFGPDLPEVAQQNGLGIDEVISYHTNTDYYVYFTGFLPSFPFLGGMPKEIAAPRLREPRKQVPAGSVGIAGGQTGIYPLVSPGGWRIIGRTPVALFQSDRQQPFLLKAGDWLRFIVISENEFGKFKG